MGEAAGTEVRLEPERAAWRPATHWLLVLLVVAPLLVAGIVGLPLFQDGSSYLLELMTSHSAVRHHRYSVLIVQAPSIMALKLSGIADLDPHATLGAVRSVFSLSYAIVPLLALAWSWLLVSRRDPSMMLWPAVSILLLNVVNFSGVSEICLAAQFALPLLLAASRHDRSTFTKMTVLVLTPAIVLLHALVAVLFLGLACGMVMRARRLQANDAWWAWIYAAWFGAAALVRVVLDAWFATDYERSIWVGAALIEYFAMGFETGFFLFVATGSAFWFAWRRASLDRGVAAVSFGLAAFIAWAAFRNIAELHGFSQLPLMLLLLLGSMLLVIIVLAVTGFISNTVSLADRAMLILAWSAACAIVTRFALLESFPLKTGTTVLIVGIMLVFAALDSMRERSAADVRRREVFVLNAAAVFCVLVLSKAAIWNAATTQLSQVLAQESRACMETSEPSMDWIRRSPGSILNNWSLPTLGLVSAPKGSGTLLLEAGDCDRFEKTGEIVVDPWTILTAQQLPFVSLQRMDANDG